MSKIIGINPVNEAINSGKRIKKIEVYEGNKNKRINKILEKAKKNKIDIHFIKNKVDNSQGIVAFLEEEYKYIAEDELIEKLISKDKAVIVVLDELNDPRNFGAIIRSCEAFGVDGIVIPEHKSVKVNETVIKASTGACEYVDIAIVGNISLFLNKIKKIDFWVYGAEASGSKKYYEEEYSTKICLVIGSEGKGIREKVKEKCDFIINIPMYGKVNSLNASVATGIILAEILKKQEKKHEV